MQKRGTGGRRRSAAAVVIGTILVSMLIAAAPASAMPQCSNPGWRFEVKTKAVGGRFGHVGPWHTNYNGTGSRATTTLTSSATGTVTESTSVSVSAEASAFVFAKVSATIDGSIAHSKSVTTSNQTTFSTPSHYYGNGGFGYFKTRVAGHLYFWTSVCTVTHDHGTVVFKYPRGAVGWCTWNSTASEGPAGNPPVACTE